MKSLSLFVTGLIVGAIAMFVLISDEDTSYKIGNDKFLIFEKSISQNSPFGKCKQNHSALEAIMVGETADLSRVSAEIFQLQKKADDTAMQFTKEGIVRVPNAQDVDHCENNKNNGLTAAPEISYPFNSSNKDSSSRTRTHCSSLLDEQIRDVEEKKREYSELQKAKVQTSNELNQLQHECFGLTFINHGIIYEQENVIDECT